MKIKITCPCNATFEVNNKFSYCNRGAVCPNCGKRLPADANTVLMNLIDDSRQLTEILTKDQTGYAIKITHHSENP